MSKSGKKLKRHGNEKEGKHALAKAASLTFFFGVRTWHVDLAIWRNPRRRTQRHLLVQSVFWRFVFLESNEGMRRESILFSI